MINPFSANVNKVDAASNEELIEIRHDEESKTNFDSCGYVQLWKNQKMSNLYRNMWNIIFKLLITFTTSNLVQSGFSAVNLILTKMISALKISERWNIRLTLNKIEPSIRDLISKHQPQVVV